jgi:hypothetical protein
MDDKFANFFTYGCAVLLFAAVAILASVVIYKLAVFILEL